MEPIGEFKIERRQVERLRELGRQGVKIRSRALITTLWARLALGELSLESAAAAGQVQVRGSPFAVARFARAFRLEQGAAA